MELPDVPCLSYDRLRPLIRSGDILLCAGRSIFATLIQHATNSPWSHTGFLMRIDSIDRIMIVESVESIGVRAVPLSAYVRNYNATGKGYGGRVYIARHTGFPDDPNVLRQFSQGAVDLFGYPYATQDIMGIALRIVAAKLGVHEGTIVPGNGFICSEYLDLMLRSIGITIPYDPAGFIAPDDVAACVDVQVLWEVAIGV